MLRLSVSASCPRFQLDIMRYRNLLYHYYYHYTNEHAHNKLTLELTLLNYVFLWTYAAAHGIQYCTKLK